MGQMVQWSEYWFLYLQALRQMGRPVLWLPLLVKAMVAVVLALMHYNIFSPISGPIISAWTNLLRPEFADSFFHYPGHFTLFPYYFGTARLVINVLTEALFYSVMIDMLISLYRGEKPAFMRSFGVALSRYLKLTIVWAVLLAILYVVSLYFSDFVESILGYSLKDAPRRQVMIEAILRALIILIYAPCIFLLPSLMAGKVSFGAALKRGFGVAFRHPFIAIGLVLIPFVIGFFPSWFSSSSVKVVSNFSPELVFYLILVSIGVDAIVDFILLGTCVKFFMDQTS
jgi:hypothetical protein